MGKFLKTCDNFNYGGFSCFSNTLNITAVQLTLSEKWENFLKLAIIQTT